MGCVEGREHGQVMHGRGAEVCGVFGGRALPVKRAVDVVGAGLGLAALWPVALAVMLVIRLDSKGPAIFTQVRVGRDERPFRCHKLRSMHVSAPERPSHESAASDVTRVGRFLRRSKLDELPQLVNVLKGEMSLVGPRPCLPTQTRLIEARRKLGVNRARPGITGLAQVHGIDMSEPERLARTDAAYLAKTSLLGDLILVLASLPGGRRLRPDVQNP